MNNLLFLKLRQIRMNKKKKKEEREILLKKLKLIIMTHLNSDMLGVTISRDLERFREQKKKKKRKKKVYY